MRPRSWVGVCVALVMATGGVQAVREKALGDERQKAAGGVPRFEVDAFWPKELPNKWILGGVPGVDVDSQDNVWIVNRYRSLTAEEKYASTSPPKADCCVPSPPILAFDQAGKVIRSFGGVDPAYQWVASEHGLHVDYKGNVWVGGIGKTDNHILKFSNTGKFLLQIGRAGESQGSNDTKNLGKAQAMHVYEKTNEVFVADGNQNRRVVVFDADTGAYKRHWGAYGKKPDDAAPRTRIFEGPGPQQFHDVHGIRVSNDGLVYVADKDPARVQVFKLDGTFVKEVFIARHTNIATGVTEDVRFSPDKEQRYLYVVDGPNTKIWILKRDTLEILGSFGHRGRYAGQWIHLHNAAVDSKGNLYTAESNVGQRVQRFLFKGLASTSSE